MPASFVAAGTRADVLSAASAAPSIPTTGVQAGHLAIVQLVHTDAPHTISGWPTGWTQLVANNANGHSHVIGYATVTSGGANDPGATPSFTWSAAERNTARIAVFKDHSPSTPFPDTPTQTTSNVAAITVGALTTTVADSLLIGMVVQDAAAGQNPAYGVSPTPASTIWSEFDRGVTAGLGPMCFTDPAATTGSYSFTATSAFADEQSAFLIALGPGDTATRDLEGYRWRNDDGSETSATWAAAQDTGVTAATGAPRRLRTIINATGDPASTQYRLQYRRQGDPATEWEDVV